MSGDRIFPIRFERTSIPMKTDYIHHGDCAKFLPTLPDGSINLVVTSPPYDDMRRYGSHEFDFEAIAQNLHRVLAYGGVIVWVVADAFRKDKRGSMSLSSFKQAIYFDNLGLNVHDVMIWDRHSMRFPRSNGYTQVVQYMFILSRGKPSTFNPLSVPKLGGGRKDRYQTGWQPEIDRVERKRTSTRKGRSLYTNIWKMYAGYNHSTKDNYTFQHPATFPEELAHRHILTWSNPGDIVLDPMCGSGTTLKMAKMNRRRYIGCEAHKPYYDMSVRRVTEQTKITLDSYIEQPIH